MEAVGQLTGVAHDFNNLLAGILGNLELMQTRIEKGQVNDLEHHINAAPEAANWAAALTSRLLAFSRRRALEAKTTDINHLVHGMEELVRRTVGPALAVKVITAPALWNTLVDPNQLENALLNLCINARDAMPDGGKLTVETTNKIVEAVIAHGRDIPLGHYVSLSVSDDGAGMAPEVAARAFEPFYTTKPIGMGTGLGLSMIYGFTQQSGGQVRIHSQFGQGTTVRLYLPRKDGSENLADLPTMPASRSIAPKGATVLVVDDEPTVRMLVTEVLEDMGHIALQAVDATAGLQAIRSNARIDLLITDVGLPGGMNGHQFAAAAREIPPE